MAVLQYIVYLICGIFLLFVMGSYFSVAAGFTIFAVILVFLPLFLAGYFSGMSFFFPRGAAIASVISILPFFISAIYDYIKKTPFSEPLVFLIPSILVIIVSDIILFRQKLSFWSQRKTKLGKILISIFAVIPTLPATYILISFLIKLVFRASK